MLFSCQEYFFSRMVSWPDVYWLALVVVVTEPEEYSLTVLNWDKGPQPLSLRARTSTL